MGKFSKFMLGLFLLGLAIFLLIGMVSYAPLFGFLMIYPFVLDKVLGLGVNNYLSEAIAIAIGAGIWLAVFQYFLSRDKQKRLIGFLILAGVYASHSLLLYGLTRNSAVDLFTGEKKFCSEDQLTGRVRVYNTQIFADSGKKVERCTEAQIERYEIERKYADDENAEVDLSVVEKGFISPKSGRQLFFFCNDTVGIPHFFVIAGHCPWGGNLEPANSEIVNKALEVKARSHKEKQEKEDLQQKLERISKENEILKEQKATAVLPSTPTAPVVEPVRTGAPLQKSITAIVEKTPAVAEVYVKDVEWCMTCFHRGVWFKLWERAGVGGIFTEAVLNIWTVNSENEAPSVFKQRSPATFGWRLAPPIAFRGNTESRERNSVPLNSYQTWIDGSQKVWVEITLNGRDDNGNKITLTLQ